MRLFNKYSFFLSGPIFFQVLLLMFFFNIPESYYSGVFFLPLLMIFQGFFLDFLFRGGIKNSLLLDRVKQKNKVCYNFVAGVFLFFVIFLVPIDIYFNGFKILNPSSYAELDGIGRYVRHLTNFSWVAIPYAYLCVDRGRKFYRVIFWLLIFFGLLIPIMFVDRNRLLLSFFCLIYFYVFQKKSGLVGINKKSNFKLFLIVFFILIVFGALGAYRSGSSFLVLSSGDKLVNGYYPLKNFFYYLPNFLQQIVLYVTTPILNFATVFEKGFINSDFLFSQLSPFSRDLYDAYPFSPVLVPRYNVGTEFYPFLLYGGAFSVITASVIISLLFLSIVKIYQAWTNIFTLLLFLKMAYSLVMIGFAPQILIFYNLISSLVLIVLCMFAWLLLPFVKQRQR